MIRDTYVAGVRAAHRVVSDKASTLARIAKDLQKISDGDPRYSAAIAAIGAQVSLLTVVGGEIAMLSTEGPDDTPSSRLPEAPPAA